MKLVIVESPTKAQTIKNFLGQDYLVLSSYGHIRDLPKSKLGIDIENNFQPQYIIMPKAKKNIKLLKSGAKKAEETILATDEDREGEAIAWHLAKALDLKDYKRIVFHEITEEAIKTALENSREIDINLVDSQQGRRILDRLVGYKLSPFLWKKVFKGLSAGRVQSVAVRLVVEKEREIQNFVPQEYWEISGLFKKPAFPEAGSLPAEFEAMLVRKNGEIIPKLGIKTKDEAEKIVKDLEGAQYKVADVEKKETKKNPFPPFTTSTLQQTAWQRFRFPAKFTMRIAQNLYEKGFITYHRTDSLNLSDSSLFAAKKFIVGNFGEEYWAGFLRKYKTKTKGAQEAHEAIRPTYPDKTPETIKTELDDSQLKLYGLIWSRFVACQMAQACFYSTAIDISAGDYLFRATGQILKFDGFLKVYPFKFEETELPLLEKDEILDLIKLSPSQHFTQPPSRYTEATLIKTLEKYGIGRPSTYAPILSTIQERNYVEKDEKRCFKPTDVGFLVNDVLVKHFPKIVDIKFTAEMEEDLDKIAQGKIEWTSVIKEFYAPFEDNLKKKYEEVSKKDITENSLSKEQDDSPAEKQAIAEKKCPKCGGSILIRLGRFGKFYACSNFPKCKYTESIKNNNLGMKCPKCEKGEIVEKRTKRKKIFYGCNRFPECDFALWDKPTKEKCPKCGSIMVEKNKKNYPIRNAEGNLNQTNEVKCSNKDCK